LAKRKIKDSVVTITGGTGSFGSTMLLHLLHEGASEVRVFSRDEAKQDDLRHRVSDPRVRFYIGDTRDPLSVKNVMKGTDLVFHAAALKQVPSAEFFPLEAVATNIQGSANVLREALDASVSSVVCLSTDKAVYPINAMGMSKALMEKTAFAFARDNQGSKTTISVTRYGNVMYSRGSVIPLFVNQIKSGNPITITAPAMTRFLMSLTESVELVKHALENAEPGDLFVRKAPAATIGVLVDALLELFEAEGARALDIRTIGVRHGEKFFESLLGAEEMAKAEDLGGYFRVPLDTRTLDYEVFFEKGENQQAPLDSYTSHNTQRLDKEEVKALLLTLPEIRQELGL
jgi:UDP-N-acetylglucosamine 4,6-dehydratase/5-epimerase